MYIFAQLIVREILTETVQHFSACRGAGTILVALVELVQHPDRPALLMTAQIILILVGANDKELWNQDFRQLINLLKTMLAY